MNDRIDGKATQSVSVGAGAGRGDAIVAKGRWSVECRDADGALVWTREIENLITTAGLNKILTEALKGSSYTAAWYAGLVDNSGFSAYDAADTLASHAGWTEFSNYTGNRKAITFGSAAGGVLASSAIATFTIGGAGTLDGLFVADVDTGTSGTLLSAGAFTGGDAPVASGYVVTATYQITLVSG